MTATAALAGTLFLLPNPSAAQATCERSIAANVVALDQVFFYNRLGAFNPAGMIYALRRDVVDFAGTPLTQGGDASPGAVMLREDKRPRPLVLRMNVGDCLTINFQNLLATTPVDDEQPATRSASVHVLGMQLVNSIADDGSNVGNNASSLAAPGEYRSYTIYAEREGGFLLNSTGAMTGGEGDGGSTAAGLFGAVNVEPRGAEWYRSQLTRAELDLARNPITPALATGHPNIDYTATYPLGHTYAGLPILNMLQNNEIVHADITAIITGPGRGDHLPGTYPPNVVNAPNATLPQAYGLETRTRAEPFREFTAVYHDEIMAIQAFDGLFEDAELGHTLHCCRDGFAINYATGGIGAEILANRLGVGPMADCNECKYEEFFLSAWTVGDPGMVVDRPANDGLEEITPTEVVAGISPALLGPKATKAVYPDDPSNVYHGYIGDHTKFRVIHAGPKEHHIHHQHAHQWLFTPDSDTSTYIDSQAIGPGSNYNLEITYNGAGNRNQVVGDSIFHCHFYPHFAQGMWALWRTHDTFEEGTEIGPDGIPVAGARALPDGEILAGTPIPAVVPVPTLAMAPLPGDVGIVDGQVQIADASVNPGYPFWVPGVAGHRAPHPPLDTIDDGGLPRHVVVGGETEFPPLNRLDFSKENKTLDVKYLSEAGEPVEQTAMLFHEQRTHASITPEGVATKFVTNGAPRTSGAPYANPCVDDFGNVVGTPRVYKAAHIQLDMVLNKVGDHYPQARIHSLWGDVAAIQGGTKAPEPMFLRVNTNDCIEYQLTSLLPSNYELDDYQVRTPTDITGQHIHLVKFDVTASDGAANGWNYEDGVFVPGEVQERIAAINAFNAIYDPTAWVLTPEPHPYFGAGPDNRWLGAQTMVQRWFADDVLNNTGQDRTLRSIYTHDHFSPSTHQQAGLYAALVAEPEGSQWRNSETGEVFGTRFDGGPTSWRADILTPGSADSYREFMLEFADFQLAYNPGPLGVDPATLDPSGELNLAGNFVNPALAINAPGREEIGLPLMLRRPDECPGDPLNPPSTPCPEGVSAQDPGTFSVNYRNESIGLRVMKPADPLDPTCEILPDAGGNPTLSTCVQTPGIAGDLAFAFRSDVTRAIPALNTQPAYPPPLTADVRPGDPFTPLMRAYQGDKVVIRTLVGAHEEGHNVSIHGLKWLEEPSDPASGWRNAQMMGISEQFNFETPVLPAEGTAPPQADYLWATDASTDGYWNGMWGLLRAYAQNRADLLPLPSNPVPPSGNFVSKITNAAQFAGVCPVGAPPRNYTVVALAAKDALPANSAVGKSLVYNSRTGAFAGNPGPLHDPTGLFYARSDDVTLGVVGRRRVYLLKPDVPVEPLILRANAGDCISVTLINGLRGAPDDRDGFNFMPMVIEGFNLNQVVPSANVGLHAQLVASDVTRYNGVNVGLNQVAAQTAAPGRSYRYRWYAGHLELQPNGTLVGTPVEFGATSLMPADSIKHSNKGLIGSLIIEPQGSNWVEDGNTRAAATINHPGGSFREFVVQFQDDINLVDKNGVAVVSPVGGERDDAEDSGHKAVNYRTEPMWFRLGFAPEATFEDTRARTDFDVAVSNTVTGGADPETPVFPAKVGDQVRFRVLQAAGHPRNHVFQVHGHVWQREPYIAGTVPSQAIGDNPLSDFYGAQAGHGPANHFDVVLENGAGGAFGIPGDYLYRDQASFQFDGGTWGLMRVTEPTP